MAAIAKKIQNKGGEVNMKKEETPWWIIDDTPPKPSNKTPEEARASLLKKFGSLPTKEEEEKWLEAFYNTPYQFNEGSTT